MMYQHFRVIVYILFATCISCVVGQADFTGANWIWTPGRAADGITYPPGNVSLRRDFTATNGKVPILANILITTDNNYTLYVNGNPIGSGIDLSNVFAVEAENYPPTGAGNVSGVLAVIVVRYSNGFIDTIYTDGEWQAINGTIAEQVEFDDSHWPAAFVEGPYPSTAPWNQPSLAISIPPVSQDPGPSLQSAFWIWTNELTGPGSSVPIGSCAFRRTVVIPNGGLVAQARALIATDDQFTLYINGLLVGSGTSFTVANRYVVNFPPTSRVVIAVYASNLGGPAGVFAAFDLVSCDCSHDIYVVTDSSWKYNWGTPAGFIGPKYNDLE